jgi:hypothetical protein
MYCHGVYHILNAKRRFHHGQEDKFIFPLIKTEKLLLSTIKIVSSSAKGGWGGLRGISAIMCGKRFRFSEIINQMLSFLFCHVYWGYECPDLSREIHQIV